MGQGHRGPGPWHYSLPMQKQIASSLPMLILPLQIGHSSGYASPATTTRATLQRVMSRAMVPRCCRSYQRSSSGTRRTRYGHVRTAPPPWPVTRGHLPMEPAKSRASLVPVASGMGVRASSSAWAWCGAWTMTCSCDAPWATGQRRGATACSQTACLAAGLLSRIQAV